MTNAAPRRDAGTASYRTRSLAVPLAAALLLAAAAGGCKPREDYTTPRRAVRSFYVVLMTAGTTDAVRRSIADAAHADVAVQVKALVEAVVAAQDEAVRRFGDGGKSASAGLPTLDDIDAATETISGETATLRVARLGGDLRLRRVAGLWKVEVDSLLGLLGLGGADADSARRAIAAASAAARDVARQIAAGRYATSAEAAAALETQVKLAAAQVDLSSPKRALRALYASLTGPNPDAARAAVADALQAAVVPDLQQLVDGVLAAQRAAVKQFGDDGKAVAGGLPSLADLEAAAESRDGATALLTLANGGAGAGSGSGNASNSKKTVRCLRIGADWKVDAFSILGLQPRDQAQARRLLAAATAAAATVADQIKAGRYATPADASAALDRQVQQAVMGEWLRSSFGG